MINDDDSPGDCELLGFFSLFIQLCLGMLTFSTLIVKWSYERPRRPVNIWLLDVLKQAIGALTLHFGNIAISQIASQLGAKHKLPGECTWYFLNVLCDTSVGVPTLYFVLKLLHHVCSVFNIKGTRTGEYGLDPERPKILFWGKQLIIFLIGLFFMKLCALLVVSLPFMDDLGVFLLQWFKNPSSLIFFVMFAFPLLANVIQVFLIDEMLEKKDKDRGRAKQIAVTDAVYSIGCLNERGPLVVKDIKANTCSAYTASA